jgi:RNA polymerase sigma-70 factor (ECF subfamily)
VTLPSSDHGPERSLEQRQNEQLVRKALQALTPEQREAILLSRYQGLSYAEIAQIAGCSEGAVKTRVFRAMETLKKALTGEASGGDRWANAVR